MYSKLIGITLDLSGSRDVNDHVTIRLAVCHRSFPIGGLLEPSLLCLTVFEIFNGECDAVVDMTLNDL